MLDAVVPISGPIKLLAAFDNCPSPVLNAVFSSTVNGSDPEATPLATLTKACDIDGAKAELTPLAVNSEETLLNDAPVNPPIRAPDNIPVRGSVPLIALLTPPKAPPVKAPV